MNEERAEELLTACLEGMDDDDLVNIYNKYCEDSNYTDDMIFPMYELPDYIGDLSQYTLGDLFGRFQLDDFDFDHPYFRDTIYGIESIEDVSCIIDISDIVDHIIWREDCLENKAVQEILDQLEDEGEDEESEA